MCTVFADTLDTSSKKDDFSLIDIHAGKLLEKRSLTEMEKEIYVKDADGTIHKNANAILRIIGLYERWRWVEILGRLPIVNQLLHLGYGIVAQNRHFVFGPLGRLFWLKTVLVLGFVAGILLALPLWLSERAYPSVPVFEIVPSMSSPLGRLFLVVLTASLGLSLFLKEFRLLLSITLGLTVLLVLFDQSRLQPWVYQYTAMLGVLVLFAWRRAESQEISYALNVCRFIVASMYFYSGLQKLNIEFFTMVFPWVIEPIAQVFPSALYPVFFSFGLLVPWIEMLIGIFLLMPRYRTVGVWGAFLMCAFVLITLGGHGWNVVVWPWNLTLLACVLLLFVNTKHISLKDIVSIGKRKLGLFVLLLFGILPMLSFFNLWDSYPSWSLYSGTVNQGTLHFSEAAYTQLPQTMKEVAERTDEGVWEVPIAEWSFEEMNVPPYPESRVYKSIMKSLCNTYTEESTDITLEMTGRIVWGNGKGAQTVSCGM
jgi:predicted DCC family thiol-disulfide oxidoreductase YuxK/uncharacterized membrane protein YphA (DoxX/SURF4 family)